MRALDGAAKEVGIVIMNEIGVDPFKFFLWFCG
jgi:saccharopine dehydrogenase-like NADP-dependent oxidoreductase